MDHASASPIPHAVELDALRLLTLVHQLGEPLEEEGARLLRGEERLLALDHLLGHPETLALLLLDALERLPELKAKSAGALRRLRFLLDAENPLPTPTFHRARSRDLRYERKLTFPTLATPWRRRDDALAHLTCRALLGVETRTEGGQKRQILAYRLTPRGADLLEQRFYPSVKIAATYLKQCAAIREYLPDYTELDFEMRLASVAERLEDLRREDNLPREQDAAQALFERVFREKL